MPSNIPQFTQGRAPQTLPNIMNEEFIVGLDEDVETLVTKLKGADGKHRSILAITGMGGSGKTTLARKLYNHEEVKRHFTGCLAWVCVSQVWDAPKLLCEICEQLLIPLREGESSLAGLKVQEFLRTSPCFVVLDDVWKTTALQELVPFLLPSGVEEGRGGVLITTRNEGILHFQGQGGVYIHKARVLTAGQSWDLFSKIVRSAWDGVRSLDEESEFAKLGKEMLETCLGLPLAVVALVGILSTRCFIQDWKALKTRVTSAILGQNEVFLGYGSVKSMLELSYLDLPYDLKPCFIYLGIFPEDSHIEVERLILLWIGEGLIRTDMCREGETLEELSMDFVDKLVQRCVVQVVSWNYKGKAKKIQIHDLMRDLCLRKAKELEFFEIASQSATTSNPNNSLSRRAIFHGSRRSHTTYTSRLRSVVKTVWVNDFLKLEIAQEKMKLLRVLHLTKVDLGDSALDIGNLILLRYLHIQKCKGVTTGVLESLKRLANLLNLALIVDKVTMPNNMLGSMKQLRYLCVEGVNVQFKDLSGVEGSRSLLCLQSKAGEWLSKELQAAAAFIHTLRTLSLQDINSQAQLDSVYGFVSNPSNRLKVLMLTIDGKSKLEFDLEGMKLKSCQHLEDITLEGRLKGPLSLQPNILSLMLKESKIEKVGDLERALSKLHELRRLKLCGCVFQGNTLTMTGLPQLQRLKLFSMENLKEWIIDEGSLLQLKKLDIIRCEKLRRIPQGLRHIRQLEKISVDMPSSFTGRLLRPNSSEEGGGGRFPSYLPCAQHQTLPGYQNACAGGEGCYIIFRGG